jgi:hypothetical protein
MKRFKTIISYTLYTLLVAFTFGCDGGTTKIETKDSYVTVVIESCEYMYKEGVGYRSLVHKGNCTNEIHKCNCY